MRPREKRITSTIVKVNRLWFVASFCVLLLGALYFWSNAQSSNSPKAAEVTAESSVPSSLEGVLPSEQIDTISAFAGKEQPRRVELATDSAPVYHEASPAWRNSLRERAIDSEPMLPGMKYHPGTIGNLGPIVTDELLQGLESKKVFNPKGVVLSDDERSTLRATLQALLAERQRLAARASEVASIAIDKKRKGGEYMAVFQPPHPEVDYLYNTYKRSHPEATWSLDWRPDGTLAVIVVHGEEAPDVVTARQELAMAWDAATEFCFTFFEVATNRRSTAR